MNEDQIKTEMRFWALEIIVCNLLAIQCLQHPTPLELLKMLREQSLMGARLRTFPGFDPAMSDLLSAELEAAIGHLMGMAHEQIGVALGHRKS
jgi:hypothetical protein